MNIALIGYGKMGKTIETIAVERGHHIVLKIDIDNQQDFTRDNLQKAQVAIEFTSPKTAYDNVVRCLEFGVPVVSGSTGWYQHLPEVKKLCADKNGSMLCASNFSLGVNIFFHLNKFLARIMNNFSEYNVEIEETHHIHKLDAPSGTAITLAEGIIDNIDHIKQWELNEVTKDNSMSIRAIREDEVPGTHVVKYASSIDDIEIVHTAHNRQGLALGAVLAAEFIHTRKGVFSMDDLLNLGK